LNTHVSKATARLVAARDWLTVFQLPPYACELNPVESVSALLKRSLAALIKTRLRRMQLRAGLFDGFLTGTRLDLTPLRSLRN
jgi:transposase